MDNDPETIEVDKSWVEEVLSFLEQVRSDTERIEDEYYRSRANDLRIQFGNMS